MQIVAPGGVGKTQLTKKWREKLLDRDDHGAVRVYDWSFYSQGTQQQASADDFFDKALRWFGEATPENFKDPWAKGERLAELVREQRTLLILDGLEPLQHPPGPLRGELADPSLQALLRALGDVNPGLCVVTTRESVPDLASMSEPRRRTIDLTTLNEADGAELLTLYGVIGSDEELRQASRDYDGHALALILLGTFLRDWLEGDIKRQEEASLLRDRGQDQEHAHRVMSAYVAWFENEPDHKKLTEDDRQVNRAAVSILHLMGLFNRPADAGCLNALRAAPPINNLTESLFAWDNHTGGNGRDGLWQQAVLRLRKAHLLADNSTHDSLDAHPLVREHFAEQLEKEHNSSSVEAHRRLYEHLKSVPKDEQPDNLNDMMPLYHAVPHGCKAGLWQESYINVYRARILQGDSQFSPRKLGAFGSDLSSMASFFNRKWDEVTTGVDEFVAGSVLSNAAFFLRATGRLSEATQPIRMGLEIRIGLERWRNAAPQASNLSELSLTLGDVSSAVRQGEQSVELADRSGDAYQRQSRRTTLGAALFCAGDFGRRKDKGGRAKTDDDSSCLFSPSSFALAAFREAEAMQQESQPQYSLLYSLQGYRYCELLLGNVCQRIRGVRFQLARSRPNRSQRSDVPALSGAPETLHRSGNDEGERQGASPMALELSGDEVAERRKPPGVGESSGTTPDGLRRTATTLGPQEEPVASALPLTEENVAEDAPAALRPVRPKLDAYATATRELQSEIESIRNRAETTLKIAETALTGILNRALDHLTLGRTWQLSAVVESAGWSPISHSSPVESGDQERSEPLRSLIPNLESPIANAEYHLTQSITLLHQAGHQENIACGLLHRAVLWREMLSFHCDPTGSASGDADSHALPAGSRLNELLANAERDLSEAETIAERGSMLIWQIEAALERSQLYLTLHEIGWKGDAPPELPSEGTANDTNGASPSRWLELAREKLAETKELITKTEKPYEPHVPDWEEWEPPEYVGVFKPGQIVGYHCRDEEIRWLEEAVENA